MGKLEKKVFAAFSLIMIFMIFGTIFYHYMEDWKYIDSFYFSAMTLTTVGYGDLVPSSDLSKIVTVIFSFSGIGIVLYSLSIIAQSYFLRNEARISSMRKNISKVSYRRKK